MALSIRPMASEDKTAIMQILYATPEFQPTEVVVAEEVLDCYLYDPPGSGYHALVAEIGSLVVGYICYGPAPLTEGTWEIYWLAVASQKQGRGIGGALIEAAENKIKAAQGRQILLETSSKPNYEKTRRFHCGQGYQAICQVPDFYAPGDHKLIFQKSLH